MSYRVVPQGCRPFDKENMAIGIKVSSRSRAAHSQPGNDAGPQVYIGVMPEDYYAVANWQSEIAANGMPARCIAWGMQQDAILVCSGDSTTWEPFTLQGTVYTEETTVSMRLMNETLEFYVGPSGAEKHVASVLLGKDGSLRPFVAVLGRHYECNLVEPNISMKQIPASTGKASIIHLCMFCK
jgi:hypothetical protein